MRFLVDNCVSWRVAQALRELGHDAVHVVQVQMSGASDTEVLALAVAQQRVVVTQDADYEKFYFRARCPLPSTVLFRDREGSWRNRTERLVQCLPHLSERADQRVLIIIQPDQLEIRRLF